MQKKIRRIVSVLFFLLFIAATQDVFQGIAPSVKKAILSVQIVPAVMQAFHSPGFLLLGAAVVLLVSFMYGRLYCSTICPLGFIQDVFIFLHRKLKKRFRFSALPNYKRIRYGISVFVVIGAVFGFVLPLILLDPFSYSGKLVTAFLQPVILLFNNGSAYALGKLGYYWLPPYDFKLHPLHFYLLSGALLLIIFRLSFFKGRWFCNVLCPVGTFLGLIAKLAPKKITIDTIACKGCGVCERVCKAGCIDTAAHTIDFERCVVCYNCIDVCPSGVIYTDKNKVSASNKTTAKKEVSRKEFLAVSAVFTLQALQTGSKLPETGESRVTVIRKTPVSPPGSNNIQRFTAICTACQQCTSLCPSLVLQPSLKEYSWHGIMQPVMNFSFGYCNFECTLCTEICPTGALLPVSPEDKKRIQLGKAKFVKDNCIVITKGTECGACSEHCPTKAVKMVPYQKLRLPEVTENICIGCGACEYACPVKPYKAIYIEGNQVHARADKPSQTNARQKEEIPEEFPF